MNLSIITILMLTSFSIIYGITYNNIQKAINQYLYKIVDEKKEFKSIEPKSSIEGPKENISQEFNFNEKELEERLPDKLVYFIVETDLDGNVIETIASFYSEEDFYQEALEIIYSNDRKAGNFTLEDNDWAYLVKEHEDNYIYGFLDMTAEQKVLDRLLYTFIFVSAAMIFLIVLISNFLTNRSIKPIKEAFDRQKQFISDASHELKTPLAVIGTNVDVLLSNQTSKDSQDWKWLEYIKSEVERMGNLTKDLLYLTQMEGVEKQDLFRHSFNLSEKIEQQILGMEVLAFEKNIEMEYEVEPYIIIEGNSEQLIQVVMILLDNALKYTPEQGKINLVLRYSNHQVVLSIKNTGEGIQSEDINKIFDRFYRVDKARSRTDGSHGLGLSIAKAIVEQHEGKIFCESISGEITIFTVKLKA
jgi:signal transduction histidine kinase